MEIFRSKLTAYLLGLAYAILGIVTLLYADDWIELGIGLFFIVLGFLYEYYGRHMED